MEIKLLSCPLCLKPHFHDINEMRSTLISVATSPLACPVCNELLMGLDKLTIHLFSHVPSIVTQNSLSRKEDELDEKKNLYDEEVLKSNITNVPQISSDIVMTEVNEVTEKVSSEISMKNNNKIIFQEINEIMMKDNCEAVMKENSAVEFYNKTNVLKSYKPYKVKALDEECNLEIFKTLNFKISNDAPNLNINNVKTINEELNIEILNGVCSNGTLNQTHKVCTINEAHDIGIIKDTINMSKTPNAGTITETLNIGNNNNNGTSKEVHNIGSFNEAHNIENFKESRSLIKTRIDLAENFIEKESNRPYHRCDICNYTFSDDNILEMHQKLLHQTIADRTTGLYSYHCHLCSKKFKMKGSLMVHLRVAHYGFVHQASSSANDFNFNVDSTESLQNNKEKINDENKTEQYKINTTLKNESEETPQQEDSKKEQGNKQWECEVCSKMFTTKYFLKKHKRLHTGEMPYYCGQCNKYFTFQQSFHKHMLYHSSDKPHVCNECGRAFKELSTLHNHKRIHSGERPFACETCGKCFRQRVSYLVHRRIHTGVMPYKCTACNKTFRYKVSQRSHKCSINPPGQVVRTADSSEGGTTETGCLNETIENLSGKNFGKLNSDKLKQDKEINEHNLKKQIGESQNLENENVIKQNVKKKCRKQHFEVENAEMQNIEKQNLIKQNKAKNTFVKNKYAYKQSAPEKNCLTPVNSMIFNENGELVEQKINIFENCLNQNDVQMTNGNQDFNIVLSASDAMLPDVKMLFLSSPKSMKDTECKTLKTINEDSLKELLYGDISL